MCLKEQFSHYWNNNRTINIIFIAYKNGYHGQNCSSSCPIPGYLCVTVTLHTVILLMAVNNLQGVLIFIKYTPKVFRWQNLCTRRFGEKTEEIVWERLTSNNIGSIYNCRVKHWDYSFIFDWSYKHEQSLGEADF